MQPHHRSAATLLALVLLAAGCGGGGSERAEQPAAPTPPAPAPPVGLTERPAVANLVLPGTSGSASVQLVRRFPGLGFAQALWSRPVPGTNRMLVLRQDGSGHTFVDEPLTTTSTLVLDLRSRTRNEGELGLLGAAFDPNFLANRYIYLHYNPADGSLRTRIARFEWQGPEIDPASELILLETDQPFANHNGGSIEFGPDGFLYIALGDGGSGGDPLNNAQNTGNLLGAISRIDVADATAATPYRIPPDNPWASTAGSRAELWAIGLRNPFRISFDPATGDLWAGDVGQAMREEIDLIVAGGNYGWRVFEGNLVFERADNNLPDSAFTAPVIDLRRSDARSVTGGEVYRGSVLPALNGSYIYGDFATGNIWSLQRNPASAPQNTLLGNLPNPAFFGADTSNESLITSYTDGFFGLQDAANRPSTPATTLSSTGLFADLATLTPATGLIEYAINEPSWTDGSSGQRWFSVPADAAIGFNRELPWTFPAGSVFVQQINIDTVDRGLLRLETRVLVNTENGWQAFTWVWNQAQDDAQLTTSGSALAVRALQANGSELAFDYQVPPQGECLGCHNSAAGFVLGAAQTHQLNRSFDYPLRRANQLDTYNAISLFGEDVLADTSVEVLTALPTSADDTAATVAERARAYLDVNCAQCHLAGGPTGSTLDLRASLAVADLNAIDVPPAAGAIGLPDARIVAPGNSASSVLLARMRITDGNRMPPVGSTRVDDAGVALVQAWIDSL